MQLEKREPLSVVILAVVDNVFFSHILRHFLESTKLLVSDLKWDILVGSILQFLIIIPL